MDTKSKRYRRAPLAKTLAFILACLCLCVTVYTGMSMVYSLSGLDMSLGEAMESTVEADYTASSAYSHEVSSAVWTLYDALAAGQLSPSAELYLGERAWYYGLHDLSAARQAATEAPEPDYDVATTTVAQYEVEEGEGAEVVEQGETFVMVMPADRALPLPDDVVLSNVTGGADPAVLRSMSGYVYLYENSVLQSNTVGIQWINNTLDSEDPGYTLYLAFRPEYIAARQAQWDALRATIMPAVWTMLACVLAALAQVTYLSFVTGRRPGSDELFLSPLDSIYSDILLCLLAGFGVAWVAMGGVLVESVAYGSGSASATSIWFAVILTAICTPGILALWLSIMRKIKARRLMRHSLIWSVCSGIWRLIRGFFALIGRFFTALFSGRRFQGYPFAHALFRRQTTFIVLSFLLVAGFMLFAFGMYGTALLALGCVFAELVLIYYYVRANNHTFQDMEKICTQAFEIYQGNMDYDPGIDPDSPLYDTSGQLLDVGAGMDKAMQRQLQSERMKIALVTNVSHDLKTPLTSIIGYIDLLSKDEQLSPEARDYVTILASKSQRLKTIIEDLFDLAKTTSGDETSLNLEVLDLKRLLEQTLADMEDKVERSGQVVRLALPELPAFVTADGRKLYRVIQNIMDNALKYSMPGTRIFVSLSQNGQHARMVFKNTASYEMDFTAEEILERFVRGDRSRTTEGSGLGLSIAEGFTRALGGDLKVTVDGDQFRVELTFATTAPPAEAEAEAEPEPEPLPPGLRDRMDILRGKLYSPRPNMPAAVILPREEGHFEPERPVAPEELADILASEAPGAPEAAPAPPADEAPPAADPPEVVDEAALPTADLPEAAQNTPPRPVVSPRPPEIDKLESVLAAEVAQRQPPRPEGPPRPPEIDKLESVLAAEVAQNTPPRPGGPPRPPEIDKLESVLAAFDTGRWQTLGHPPHSSEPPDTPPNPEDDGGYAAGPAGP